MKIDYSQQTNFQATLVNTRKISRLLPDAKKYTPEEVSFVKLDPKDIHDIWALCGIKDSWQNDRFALNIFHNAHQVYLGKKSPKYEVYALTKQKDNFEKLDCNDILGVVDLERLTKRDVYVSRLQTKPDYVYATKPEYKGIGTAIIESIKETCSAIRLYSESEKSVKRFYQKLGFKPTDETEKKMIWKKSVN